MTPYEKMAQLAKKHSYASFTGLQEAAFRNADTYCGEKNLFVIGPTSSGKTLIPLLLYLEALTQAKQDVDAPIPKMLFVVPYRALAAQKLRELQEFFAGQDLTIVQSTGEYRQDDDAIQTGNLDIAIVIAEKIYKYESRDPGFLAKYDYMVLDEIGLIENNERGIRLDFVLAWGVNQHRQCGKPRIIALGTPFYDWSSYIDSYGFVPIRSDRRPVELSACSIFYDKYRIHEVTGNPGFLGERQYVADNWFQRMQRTYGEPATGCNIAPDHLCPVKTPCRTDPGLPCPVTGRACTVPVTFLGSRPFNVQYDILVRICRHHLELGHQILIFLNDREGVRQMCSRLYQELKELLDTPPSVPECRQSILEESGLERDDVYGIMEDQSDSETDFYQAFCSGIAFHSAALPNELRTYVENNLLQSRKLKLVCSTETLAFGVNSSVDVVIIADMQKQQDDSPRYLTANEYKNYVGRAGRSRVDSDLSQLHGYVYTLVRENQRSQWEAMLEEIRDPGTLHSRFLLDDGQKIPFFLLNLLPAEDEKALSVKELTEMVRILPQDSCSGDDRIPARIREAIQYLEEKHLARKEQYSKFFRRSADRSRENRYCLTEQGQDLRGYIIGSDDYELLQHAVRRLCPKDSLCGGMNRTRFLYDLLQTKHAQYGLNSIFTRSETRLDRAQSMERIRSLSTDPGDDLGWLSDCDVQILSVLAAFLSWCDGASASALYHDFGVHYALLDKLANQIGYLIEITQAMLQSHMEAIWAEQISLYRSRGLDYERLIFTYEDFSRLVLKRIDEVHNLFISVYYGVNTDIAQELLDDLNAFPEDPGRASLAREYSLDAICPDSARALRKVSIRYRFFRSFPDTLPENIEARNNLLNQKDQYIRDIRRYSPYIEDFFSRRFPNIFIKNEVAV